MPVCIFTKSGGSGSIMLSDPPAFYRQPLFSDLIFRRDSLYAVYFSVLVKPHIDVGGSVNDMLTRTEAQRFISLDIVIDLDSCIPSEVL